MQRREAFSEAQRAWPGVSLEWEAFCTQLDALGWTGTLPGHPEAVFLCEACAQGDAEACRILEANHIATIRTAVAKVVHAPERVDDVVQQLWDRLLCGPNPRVRTYRGTAPLGSWLRVVATRMAVDAARQQARLAKRTSPEPQWEEVTAPESTSLESVLFHQQHGPVARQALEETLASLPAEERRVLKLSIARQMSVDAIGAVLGVHRSTAARRVARAREQLLRGVRSRLREALGGLRENELQSLLRELPRELDTSLSRLFASEG